MTQLGDYRTKRDDDVRFANINGRAALVRDGRYIDLHSATDGKISAAPGAFLQSWTETLALAVELAGDACWEPIGAAVIGPPVPRPVQSFGIGLNYADHALESGRPVPDVPLVFGKLAGSLCGPSDDLLLPSESVDWEAELVVALGAPVDRATAQEGIQAIAGFMVGQDFSDRGLQRQVGGGQHTLGKSFRTFGPTGPALVTLDELAEPFDLGIECRVNGEVVQSDRTSHMLVPIGHLIEVLSARLPLSPGDLIFTGTPAGIGSTRNPPRFLRPGDLVETEIAGVGRLENRCIAGPELSVESRPAAPGSMR